MEGSTLKQIKEYLEDHQIKTATGKEIWATAVIQKILKNEKYKGDSLLQKTYTEDFITGNERGKVVWRCATRIEKGKESCSHSPNIDEKWIQNVLGEKICGNSGYNEEIGRNKVERIFVFSKNLEIQCKDESAFSIKLLQNKM